MTQLRLICLWETIYLKHLNACQACGLVTTAGVKQPSLHVRKGLAYLLVLVRYTLHEAIN